MFLKDVIMNFSYLKANTLKPKKELYFQTFLLAILVSAAFFVPYMVISEGYFTFYGDFNVQQIPFYQECHKAIREGNIFWSFNTDLGANFIGSYSFYLLGSPFFWLTILFPNFLVPYLMGPLLILKFGCAAISGYAYIRRFTRTPQAAQLGALLYAFSGFSIYNIFFNHFHEAIIFFPLLLLSLELLITENKRFFFAFMVFVCAVSNYFFFFGMVVFTVIYYFVRVFSKAYKFKFSRFAVLIFEALLGLLMSSFILLPSILAITGNYRITNFLTGWNAIMYGKEQIYANILQCFFFPPDIPARPVFFPEANVKWSSLGGWLPVFSTVGVFAWFSQRKKHWLKRVIGISIFMALVPILNSAFYAFNSSYYARWFYMPILMMCLATASLTEDSKADWRPAYKWVLGITIAVSLVLGLFPDQNDDGKTTFGLYTEAGTNLLYTFRFWLTCIIAIVGLIILGILLKILKTDKKAFYKTCVACVCIVSVIYGNVFIFTGREHSYDVKEVVIDQLIEGEVDFEDNSQFRIDIYDGADNTAMFLGYSGINAFHSIVPQSVLEFYDYIGVERSVASRPDTDLYALRSLFSVKYLLDPKHSESFLDQDDQTKMPGYKYLKTQNDYYVYKNENYIPYGFSYEYYMDYDFCDQFSDNNKPAMMLKALLLTDKQIKKYDRILTNIEDIEDTEYNPSETSTLINDETYKFDCEKLAKTSAHDFKINNKGFSATVKRDKENLVFFSIPYDKGWSATVNGKGVEIEKVNEGFMAVLVPDGTSEIVFSYETPGLLMGIEITLISAIILIMYTLVYLIIFKSKANATKYPEGDLLLKNWRAEELRELRKNRNEATSINSKPDILSDTPPKTNDKDYLGGFNIDTDFFNKQ